MGQNRFPKPSPRRGERKHSNLCIALGWSRSLVAKECETQCFLREARLGFPRPEASSRASSSATRLRKASTSGSAEACPDDGTAEPKILFMTSTGDRIAD